MTILARPPLLLTTETSLRAGATPADSVPIYGTGSVSRYAIYAVPVGPYIKAGDVLDITASLHVTNNAFRPDPDPVEWWSQLVWSPDEGDNNAGNAITPEIQTYNLGDEAHHGFISIDRRFIVPTAITGTRYVKLIVYFQHPDANGTQTMDCPDNDLGMQVWWYRQ